MHSDDGGSGLSGRDDAQEEPGGSLRERVRRLARALDPREPLFRRVWGLASAADSSVEPLLDALEAWVEQGSPAIDLEPPHEFVEALVDAWLGGSWALDGLRQRTAEVLVEDVLPEEFEPIVRSVYSGFVSRPHWRRSATLVRRLEDDAEFLALVLRARLQVREAGNPDDATVEGDRGPQWLGSLEAPDRWMRQSVMSAGVRSWPVPRIPSVGDLVRFLEACGVDGPGRLATLMDARSIQETPTQETRGASRRRYHRYWRGRRLIESPGSILRRCQKAIAESILRCVPVHEAAHGFCPERGVLTAVQPHVRRPVVVVVDLEAFFPSIEAPRVHGLFQALGYPECVARALADLCTTRCLALPERRDGSRITEVERARFQRRHLPSGAPSSPDVANRIAYRLDCRLTGLAAACGARYTRYADDLIFSGSSQLSVRRFVRGVERVVSAEGFLVNSRKTRIMTQSMQQRVLGLVLNDRPRIPRRDFDALRAQLFNLARDGFESGNRDGRPDLREHLAGRVAWVRQVEPKRAGRLEDLLARIAW